MGHVLSRGRLGFLSCVVQAVLSLAACAGSDPLPSSAEGALGSAGGAPMQLDCEGRRFVAIKYNPLIACSTFIPSLDWAGEPLFDGPAVPNDLRQYCVFRWPDPATTPPNAEIAALQGNPDLHDVSEDCPVIVPQSGTLQASLSREQRGWIHAAAQGLPVLPPAPSPALLRPSRLAVVDNAPDSIGPNPGLAGANALPPILPRVTLPFGEHGEVLANLGRDLGCPGGDTPSSICAAHVETVLALQSGNAISQPGDPGYPGGLFGTRSDLARAIHRAVDDWTSDLLGQGGAEPRLVINLSLGWEDRSRDNICHVAQPGDLDSPSRAVYDAIVYARCHGALVIAASGNDTGGAAVQPRTGLVCPADFMQWDAPDGAYCDKRIFAENPTFSAIYQKITGLPLLPRVRDDVYDPLVHPVGGVDFGDQVLQPHRPWSLPPLVAPGLLGASYEVDFTTMAAASVLPQQPPETLSGTSVPTAIVSAIAATAWAYAPELAPANVMSLIHASGAAPGNLTSVEATRPPGVLPGSPFVRRASLCRTLAGMGLLPQGNCGERLAPRDAPPSSQNPPMAPGTASVFNAYYANANLDSATVYPVQIAATPLGTLFTHPAVLDVSPQPLWPSCPTCGVRPVGPGDIYLYIDPTMPLDDLFLIIDGVAYGTNGGPLRQTVSTKTVMKLTGLPPAVGAQSRAVLVGRSAGSSVYAQIRVIY